MLKITELVLKILEDNKCYDIEYFNINNSIADDLIITSGLATVHLRSVALKLKDELAEQGFGNFQIQGDFPDSHWFVVDAQQVVIHLFMPEIREYYNIEELYRHV